VCEGWALSLPSVEYEGIAIRMSFGVSASAIQETFVWTGTFQPNKYSSPGAGLDVSPKWVTICYVDCFVLLYTAFMYGTQCLFAFNPRRNVQDNRILLGQTRFESSVAMIRFFSPVTSRHIGESKLATSKFIFM
jgi:hypothetical protein